MRRHLRGNGRPSGRPAGGPDTGTTGQVRSIGHVGSSKNIWSAESAGSAAGNGNGGCVGDAGGFGTGGGPPETELLWGEPVTAGQLAAAESGYARCGPEERLLWERLSVFEGAFGRDAVREVCASGTLPPARVPAVLDRLAPLALLPVDDLFDGEEEAPRYWMPHPMRAVGARRLTERGDRRSVVLRHRRWCARLARRAADRWQGGRQLDARDLALRELPDLAAAMDPTSAPLSPNAESGTAVEITVSLWFLWVVCGRVAEGRTRLRHALALHPGPPPARALWLAAHLELEAGRPEDADPLLVQAWAAAVRDGDDRCLGLLAQLRGSTALHQGRTRAAAAEFREALALTEGPPDFGPGRETGWAGLALALARTDPEAAQEALDRLPLERAGRRAWAGRDLWADAWAHHARAELLAWDGERGRAVDHARRALRGHLTLGSAAGASCAAELLAELRIRTGRPVAAAHVLGAVDVLRSSVFGEEYRPAASSAAARRRSDRALREALGTEELCRAREEGASLGLFTLSEEP
ncbi:tetratricopeptide repeat protein [Streptomyces sp. NPDC056528]|uniref:tetratricopeptide repeat protein n=1 Tax=Streptomyces sp. NPDC056528 TaxID=3345854 RepID=UPI0036A3C323